MDIFLPLIKSCLLADAAIADGAGKSSARSRDKPPEWGGVGWASPRRLPLFAERRGSAGVVFFKLNIPTFCYEFKSSSPLNAIGAGLRDGGGW